MSTYTRGEAAMLLAAALGVPNRDWLSGWSSHEIGCGVGCRHPQNNLWACGQAAPGATDWNSAGVKNYPTLGEGIAATAANLHSRNHPQYQAMLADLQRGLTDSAHIRAGLETWCGSTCYSQSAGSFVADGKRHNNDPFDDSGGGTDTNPNENTGCVPCGALGPCCPPKVCIASTTGGIDAQCVDQSAAGVIGNPASGILPGWLINPDWGRITKALLGLVLIGFGFLLLFAILTEKAEGNPAVQTATKLAEVGA